MHIQKIKGLEDELRTLNDKIKTTESKGRN